MLYLTKTGCQWRQLPSDFPPWQTVYDHYSRWNKQGRWEIALDELNRQQRALEKKTKPELRHHRLAKRENYLRQRRVRH